MITKPQDNLLLHMRQNVVESECLSAVYIHLVFSTKDRRPFLHDKPARNALHSYLGGVSKQLDCPPLLVGGVEDHVHLLAP